MTWGYVYLISDPGGRIKVGFSSDPHARRSGMQVGSPVPLTLLATFGHARPFDVKQEVHRMLDDSCLIGEWFEIEAEVAMVSIINAMRAIDLKPPVPEIAVEETDPDLMEIDMSGTYDVPSYSPDSNVKWLLGYVRQIVGVPAGQQVQWMRAAGVSDDQLHIEMRHSQAELDLTLKDCRTGDGVLVWSAKVLGSNAIDIEDEIRAKGAKLIYAGGT